MHAAAVVTVTGLVPLQGYYMAGDGAVRDGRGYFRITGRLDDVLNVSGHRLGTAELENALTQHSACDEAAVIGCAFAPLQPPPPPPGPSPGAFCMRSCLPADTYLTWYRAYDC